MGGMRHKHWRYECLPIRHGVNLIAATVFTVLTALPATAQNFSCRIGTQPACLDYGDQVCSSSGKCVDSSSACFDQYQCDYEGFTCKSNVTECVDAHDALVRKYNDLLSDHEDLIEVAKGVEAQKQEIEFCLELANNLEDAKACRWY